MHSCLFCFTKVLNLPTVVRVATFIDHVVVFLDKRSRHHSYTSENSTIGNNLKEGEVSEGKEKTLNLSKK